MDECFYTFRELDRNNSNYNSIFILENDVLDEFTEVAKRRAINELYKACCNNEDDVKEYIRIVMTTVNNEKKYQEILNEHMDIEYGPWSGRFYRKERPGLDDTIVKNFSKIYHTNIHRPWFKVFVCKYYDKDFYINEEKAKQKRKEDKVQKSLSVAEKKIKFYQERLARLKGS